MIKFIKKLFSKEEPELIDTFWGENSDYVKMELLWHWTRYVEGTFLKGNIPMTLEQWHECRKIDLENKR